jgi:hypothetical protein
MEDLHGDGVPVVHGAVRGRIGWGAGLLDHVERPSSLEIGAG